MGRRKPSVEQKSIEKIIDNLTLFDDDLMTKVFDKNIPATELLLRVILSDSDIKVKKVKGQEFLKGADIGGRELYLDILAVDGQGRKFNVEVQRNVDGSHVKRARFHSSMIDSRMLKSGKKFQKLRETYVIFICEFDKFKKGLPIYHVDRIIAETGENFGDGSHIIYVNGSYQGEDSIGSLMNDFRAKKSSSIINSELAAGVKNYKETQKGRGIMCDAVKKYAKKYAKQVAVEEKNKLIIEMFERCLDDGISVDKAKELSGISDRLAEEVLSSRLMLV